MRGRTTITLQPEGEQRQRYSENNDNAPARGRTTITLEPEGEQLLRSSERENNDNAAPARGRTVNNDNAPARGRTTKRLGKFSLFFSPRFF